MVRASRACGERGSEVDADANVEDVLIPGAVGREGRRGGAKVVVEIADIQIPFGAGGREEGEGNRELRSHREKAVGRAVVELVAQTDPQRQGQVDGKIGRAHV